MFGKAHKRSQQVVNDDDIRALARELGSNRIWEFPSQKDPPEMGALILQLAPESRIELDLRREPTQHTTRRRDTRSVDGGAKIRTRWPRSARSRPNPTAG